MDLLLAILIVVGLAVFETINSVDNVIINSHILSTMQPKSRKWFMSWGILLSVFVVRGLLPWLILWAAVPSKGLADILNAGLSLDNTTLEALKASAGVLLAACGVFLVSIFLHWFLLEEREYPHLFKTSRRFRSIVLYVTLLAIVAAIWWISSSAYGDSRMAISALAAALMSIIIFRIRDATETEERVLARSDRFQDWGKILYLEVIDSSFSFDGVLGAFAFTFSIPLILIGNGLGAIIIRYYTIRNIDHVRKYRYLKDGAMYSLFSLGAIMTARSFGIAVPEVVTPLITFAVVGYFLYKSIKS